MQVRVSRCGDGLGIRLPEDLAARLGVSEGSWVHLREEQGRLVLSPGPPIYTLTELLAGMTPEAMHEAFDWGEDQGRERIEG
jgi:antitoxin MazE